VNPNSFSEGFRHY